MVYTNFYPQPLQLFCPKNIMQHNHPVWLNRKEYPFLPNYLQLEKARLHYLDEGQGEPIVFVHGTPSWSFDFRKLIKAFSLTHRCIAPDHIGFGLSDKPADYHYAIRNHCDNLERLLRHLQLKNITLVVHDFGGPIGMDYALKHPGRISRVVVLNSWLWDCSHLLALRRFRKLANSPLLPILYTYLNFSAKVLLPGSFAQRPGRDLLSQYLGPFAKKSDRLGCLAFARSLANDQAWFEELWQRRHVLADKEFLFVWGMADRFITPDFFEKFAGGFPNSEMVQLNCGHFPQEERPEEVIAAMCGMMKTDRAQRVK